jgi:hypothetical protein
MGNTKRVVAQLALIGLGLVCIFVCRDMILTGQGMRNGPGIPMPWVGYFLIGYSALGFFGVNIFKGGPFDPARDEPANTSDSSRDDDDRAPGGRRPL